MTLSNAFEIDQRHLGNICSETELTEKHAPAGTPIGTATTTTPLLDQPLSGPVYAVSGIGRPAAPRLHPRRPGQPGAAGGIRLHAGRLKTTVPVVPDAPIGHFRLSSSGARPATRNTRSLCGKPPVTTVEYVAQNGKRLTQKVRMKVPCGGGSSSKKKRR